MFPRRLDDPSLESRFLDEFRLEGLRSTAYAGCVGIAGYLLIWAIDVHFNGWSSVAALRRTIVIGLLCLIVGWVVLRPKQLLRNYSTLLGSLVLTAYVSSVSVTHLFREDDPTLNVNPTSIIGLWIVYGFIRLPLQVSLPICIFGSCCALFGSRVTNVSDPTVRTAVYLVIANILGATHARHLETRERELFRQRRTLEQAEIQLRDRSIAAEVASTEKTRLIAAVGHDLRQPMMAASLYLSAMERRLAARDLGGALVQVAHVQQSVKALGETLEHLLLAARYEAGTFPTKLESVELGGVLSRVREVCEPLALAKGVAIDVRVVSRKPTFVRTDEQTLQLVLMNLVSNAVKFSDPQARSRPRVVIRVVERGCICRVSVLDNGIGFTAQHAAAIWEPFFQVANSERNRDAGIGLGLYLVKRAISQLDGHHVTVKSSLGHWSYFILSIPMAVSGSAEQSHATTSSLPAAEIDLQGMCVVIVEDDVQAREALQTVLREWGASWISGPVLDDVMRAELKSAANVDALIVDYRLPGGVRGDEAIDEVRVILGHSVDAVVVTAEADQPIKLKDQLPHRTRLLLKPFEPRVLGALLGEARVRSRSKGVIDT